MRFRYSSFGSLIFASALSATAGAEEKCFKNAGLKDEETVSLNIDGSKVTGIYKIMRDYSFDTIETFDFTGTRTGKTLKVKFKGNKLPSPAMKSLDWTLAEDGEKQILRIKFNGKNYETNKFEDSLVDFESCEPSHAELAKGAKRLSLDPVGGRGKEKVKFESKDERKAFSVKIPPGKGFGITAPGLNIQFYLPNKKEHGEAGMDSFTTEKLAQGGECLLVLQTRKESA